MAADNDRHARWLLLAALLVAAVLVYMHCKYPVQVDEKQAAQAKARLMTHPPGSEAGAQAAMRYPRKPLNHTAVVVPKYTTFDMRGITTQENNTAESMDLRDAGKVVAGVVDAAMDAAMDAVAEKGKSNVVRVKASLDRKDYFVAADLPNKGKAANKLAEVNRRAQYLLQALDEQMDGARRIRSGDGVDITDSIRRIVKKHYGKVVPLAEYHHPGDLVVGSNSGKGMAIETCLRGKRNPDEWAPDNTLFRVHTHELAHSGDAEYREDGEEAHGPVFKRIHQYLLTVSENLGLYSCAEYKSSGKAFCGVTLSEDYCGGGGGPA